MNSSGAVRDRSPSRPRPNSRNADDAKEVPVLDNTDVDGESLVHDSVSKDSLATESIINDSVEVSTRSLDPNLQSQIALSAIVASWIQTRYQGESPETRRELFEDLSSQFGTVGLNFEDAVSPQYDSQRTAYMIAAESYAQEKLDQLRLQGVATGTEMVASGTSTQVPAVAHGSGSALGSGLGGPKFLRRSVSLPEGTSLLRPANGTAALVADPAAAGHPQAFKQSKLTEEYHEHEMIGRGGFGEVYKVVHKLDQACYALKKIRLKANDFSALGGVGLEASKILNEIRTLARLDHTNIVRYFNSWIEHGGNTVAPIPPVPAPVPTSAAAPGLAPIAEESIDESSDDAESSVNEFDESSAASNEARGRLEIRNVNITFEDDSYSANDDSKVDTSHILFECSKLGSASEDSKGRNMGTTVTGDKAASILDMGENATETGTSIFADGDTGSGALVRRGTRIDGPTITLHITMSLHPLSLTHYISPRGFKIHDRHCFCPLASLTIFRGIVSGVEYLHSQGVVHRDLKPGNVFLNIGGPMDCCANPGSVVVPKIGDFGLVAAIDNNPSPLLVASGSPIGTPFYSAPEGGRHPAVDVWALGVILLELLYKFGTLSERAFVLSDLTRKDDCLPAIKKLLLGDKLASIIARCCSKDHMLRYTVSELKQVVNDLITELEKDHDHSDENREALGDSQLQEA